MMEADSSAVLAPGEPNGGTRRATPRWISIPIKQLLTAFAYFGCAGIGAEMALFDGYGPLIWPALGVAVAAIYLQGATGVIGVFIGACLAQYTQPDHSMLIILLTAAAYTMPAAGAALGLRKMKTFHASMERIADVGLFMGIALIALPLLTSTACAAILCRQVDLIPWSEFLRLVQIRFLGDALGVLMIAPLLMVWRSETQINWNNRQAIEVLFWMLTLVFFGVVIYTNWAPTDTMQYPLELAFFPIMAWGAIRFGQRGATTGILLMAIMALFELRDVIGTEATKFHTQPPTTLWAFTGVVCLTSLFLAAVLTEQRNREAHARHNEERLRAFLSAMPDTAYVIERRGRIAEIFTSPTSVLAGKEQQFAGKTIEELFGEANGPIFRDLIEQAIRTQRVEVIDYRVEYEGRQYWYEGRVSAISALHEGGEPLAVWVAYDISDRKHYEESLKQARVAADAANQAKGEFLAVMSHEIRTPMNAIIGFSDIMSRTELNAQQADYLRVICSSGNNLLELINNILDYSKIESKSIELETMPFHLENTTVEVLEMVLIKAREKGIVLDYDVKDASCGNFIGDPHRLKQIILNLVNNAVKFTDEGTVLVLIETEQVDEKHWRIQYRVKDTGIGIPEDKRNRLFKAFSQVDSSTTRKFGGTGLGLVISKRLIESMGGKIWVDSVEGEGTTFSFYIDLLSATAMDTRSADIYKAMAPAGTEFAGEHPMRILVIEDDEVNRRMLVDMLLRLGYEPSVAVDGSEALEIIQRRDFDIAIADIEMPGLDGFQLLKRLRYGNYSDEIRNLYMVAHTAYALEEDRRRCLEAGFNAYLPKPIMMTDVQLILAEAFGKMVASEV